MIIHSLIASIKTIEVSFRLCGKDFISIIREQLLGDWLCIEVLVVFIEVIAEEDGLDCILDEADEESKDKDVYEEAEDQGKNANVAVSSVFHVDKADEGWDEGQDYMSSDSYKLNKKRCTRFEEELPSTF